MTALQLQFPLARIRELAARYGPEHDREVEEGVAPAVREQGYFTRKQFLTICCWNSPRTRKHVEANEEAPGPSREALNRTTPQTAPTMRTRHDLLVMLAPLCAPLADASATRDAPTSVAEIRVTDATEGCYHSDVREYAWVQDGAVYRYGERTLTAQEVEAIRLRILACRETPDDLLSRVGITPEVVASHRDEIFHAALPESWRKAGKGAKDIPAELDHLFGFEYLAPHILAELTGVNWESTTSMHFEVVLPGEPEVRVSSRGQVPWMLPWTITVGEETWSVADIELSRAVLLLADREGPSAALLDGSHYWAEGFWVDDRFWDRFVGARLDESLSAAAYAALPGYGRFIERYRVDDVMTGHVNSQPEAMFFEISARYPSRIDKVRWWNLIEGGRPRSDWEVLLPVLEAAERQVAQQQWLLDWKAAGRGKTIGIEVVGDRGYSETRMDLFVLPIWADAAFAGAPEYELLLRRERNWCGTVFLGANEPGALIRTANPGAGDHWFDSLSFSYHPRAEQPQYGRVDANGAVEVRVGPRREGGLLKESPTPWVAAPPGLDLHGSSRSALLLAPIRATLAPCPIWTSH